MPNSETIGALSLNRKGELLRKIFQGIFFAFTLFYSDNFSGQTTMTIGTTAVKIDTVYTGLDVPWEIVYGPDNNLWITERKGIVSRIDPVTKTKLQILDHTAKVFAYAESGMLGLALHPDFPTIPEVFTAYTYGSLQGVYERIVKFNYNNGQLINETILLDSIKGGAAHNGARLLFLPDKTLLVTLGEATLSNLAQNLSSPNGKVLRMRTDGSVPSDNPFPGSLVYSFGHRNSQGLAVGPLGKIYSSEHGTARADEFQVIEPGRNYGWPDVEGFCDTLPELAFCSANNVKEPLHEWTPSLAVGDILWYSNNSFPEFDGKILLTTLKDKSLVVISLDANGKYVSESKYFKDMFGRLRAVASGPNGEIYLATNGANPSNSDPGTHSIIRLKPPPPVVSVKEYDLQSGIKVYPNPAENYLWIDCPFLQHGSVTITDVMGRVVLKSNLDQNNKIDIGILVDGIYFVRLDVSEKEGQWIKIIIKR